MSADVKEGIILFWTGLLVFILPLQTNYFQTFFWNDGFLIAMILTAIVFVTITMPSQHRIKNELLKRGMGWMIFFILSLQAQWAIAQFVRQDDFGMRLWGEVRLDIDRIGVAKFLVPEDFPTKRIKLIRAYGPYPHPNVLGGMMVTGLIIMFVSRFNERGKNSMRTIFTGYVYLGTTMIAALIISFSRSAYAGLIMAMTIMAIMLYFQKQLFNKVSNRKVPIILLLTSLIIISGWIRSTDSEDVALTERIEGYGWAAELIKENGIWRGTGPGHYKESVRRFLRVNHISHEAWQVDYVHSVPLLIIAEWGIAGSLGTLAILIWILVQLGRYSIFLGPIIPLLLLDHYLVTQPAPLFLVTLLAVALWQMARQRPRRKVMVGVEGRD